MVGFRANFVAYRASGKAREAIEARGSQKFESTESKVQKEQK